MHKSDTTEHEGEENPHSIYPSRERSGPTPPSFRSLRARWPDQYAFALMVVTPKGTKLVIETEMPEPKAKKILKMFEEQISAPETNNTVKKVKRAKPSR